MLKIIIAVEVLALLGAVWQVAYWRARALRASHLYLLLAEKERELRVKLDATTDVPPARASTPLRPGDRVCTTVALSALAATDILLITRYTLDRAEPGSALGEAARRVRAIGERAADNLGVAPHLHGPGQLR